MTMEKIKWNGQDIPIPSRVAVCPECGASLIADVYEWQEDGDEWTVNEDGSGVHIQCWQEDGSHYRHPYIDWMPLDAPVIRWLNQMYDFSLYPVF